uniref:Uncharacterized protein n=1 Tax=Cacopsylla melanoneura TaxID=428564 RepID=A0A8D9BKR5_9HEMI
MLSRQASLRAQTKRIKQSLKKFNYEPYVILRPLINKIEEEFKSDKIENLIAQISENWMNATMELAELKNKHEITITHIEDIDLEKTGYVSQIANVENRIKNLIDENNEQIQTMDEELKKYKDIASKINNKNNSLEKQIIILTKQDNEQQEKITNLKHIITEKT